MHIVTLTRLNRALSTVVNELNSFGFWDDKLSKVEVYLVNVGIAYGWQYFGSTGEICIPAVSASRLSKFLGFETSGLTDVLRHEYGHAIADTHRGLFHSPDFAKAFGDKHSSEQEFEHDPYFSVSKYASKNASESFAEVVMFFLKHKGKLPAKFDTLPIRRQWLFVENLAKAIANGKTRW